jgi:hypothetical protein
MIFCADRTVQVQALLAYFVGANGFAADPELAGFP